MNLLGFEITRRKAQNLQGVNRYGSWMSSIFGPVMESYAGAWQQNVVVAPTQTLMSFSAVYACITGIASDIAKMRVKLSANNDGIWEEITKNQPWLPVLRKPNGYQSRIDFFESWMISKLMYGNAYILKQRQDRREIVTGLHVLHPGCVKPLVAEDGSVYYQINEDYLAQTGLLESVGEDRITIPAQEIIHDRMAPLWHPLVGVSPLYACAVSGTLGNNIQNSAAYFFQNRAMPGGILEVQGAPSDETVDALKAKWANNFGGNNSGKVAVLGDGLKFIPLMVDAEDSKQVEQLKFAVEDVARALHYPVWKLLGTTPPYTKPDQGQVIYYSDCLQVHIVKIEECLENGLELPLGMHTEFDIDELFRMDQQSLYESINAAGKFMKLDEQRFRANLQPLPIGGDTVYKQEQDHSIEAVAKRDAGDDPFGTAKPKALPEPEPQPEPKSESEESAPTRELILDEDEMRAIFEADLRRDLIPA